MLKPEVGQEMVVVKGVKKGLLVRINDLIPDVATAHPDRVVVAVIDRSGIPRWFWLSSLGPLPAQQLVEDYRAHQKEKASE